MPLGRTTDTPRRDAKAFVAKAEEFLRAAERAASARDYDAAADLLESAEERAPEVAQHARQLRSLLKKRNLVEYEARRATAAESRDALERAQRFVAWCHVVVERGGL